MAKGRTMKDLRDVHHLFTPTELRDPENTRKAPNRLGVILLEEGVDVAIWKIMADFKQRTVPEMRSILNEYRFDSRQADSRLSTLIRTNRWFDRIQRGGGEAMYTLKKHLPMPNVANDQPLLPAAFSKLKENLSGAVPPTRAPSAAFSGHLSHGRAAGGASDSKSLDELNKAIAQDRTEPKEEHMAQVNTASDSVSTEYTPKTGDAPLNPVIQQIPEMAEDDHLVTLIWKAMADYKPYKSEDVHVLVQLYRPSQSLKSVQNRLSLLSKEGWFEVTTFGRTNTYTLRAGIANPNLKIADLRAAGANAKHHNTVKHEAPPQQQELPHVRTEDSVNPAATAAQPPSPEETTIMSPNTVTKPLVEVVQNRAPATDVPLLDLAIQIKGEKFTFAELRTVVQELQALGYGRENGASQNLSIVTNTVRLKGVEFVKVELDTIVKTLVAEGFGKHLQTVR